LQKGSCVILPATVGDVNLQPDVDGVVCVLAGAGNVPCVAG